MYLAQRKYVVYSLINNSMPNWSNLMMALSRWTSLIINSLPPHKTPHIAIPSSWYPDPQLTKPFQVLAMSNLWLLQDHQPIRTINDLFLYSTLILQALLMPTAKHLCKLLIVCNYSTLVHSRRNSHADCLVIYNKEYCFTEVFTVTWLIAFCNMDALLFLIFVIALCMLSAWPFAI